MISRKNRNRFSIETDIDREAGLILIKAYDKELNRNWFVFENDVHKLSEEHEDLKQYILFKWHGIKSGKYQVEGFDIENYIDFPPLGFKPTLQ
ncbi:hypothetical protein [Gracilibacillus alcaliphilus]|uniref:hypothetical protein n=1 Tax=Gracilibacillus alcaliphilus TaxID=1401441 RepID=UPI00195D5677|nr:hypothetical protein [Gracilibacillus alcaliphilus]MBM7678365.1 hypothetical protein [Gracilibacillus alcaliphilus]